MAFLTEKELRDSFWKAYNNKKRAKRFQFECPIRDGSADLVTVEKYLDNWQINAFEFKNSGDLKKAFLQAEGNLKYVNRSWVVLPIENKNTLDNKWQQYLQKMKYIGVFLVEPSGRYSCYKLAYTKETCDISQVIINLMMEGV